MQNYTYYNPTRLYFGPEQIETNLGNTVRSYGSRALLIYGGGSIRKNGLYQRIIQALDKAGVEVVEFAGVEPNPQYTTVNRAAALCREKNCSVIVAAGGGSVIDAAKVVTQAVFYDGDCWDLVTGNTHVDDGLPLIAIPTMASAGSENDAWAVISNKDTNQKLDPWGESFQPVAAFVDPSITYTVSPYQTAIGAVDILSHVTDIRYFIKEHKISFINEWMESICRNVIRCAPAAIRNPDDEEARETLSLAAYEITGGVVDQGGSSDMPLHLMEYGIAAFYEIPHGHGIAILMPRWMKYILGGETAPVFYQFGKNCLGIQKNLSAVEGAEKTIEALGSWIYETLGLESHLSAFGVTEEQIPAMAKKAVRGKSIVHGLTDLTITDIENIFRMCL